MITGTVVSLAADPTFVSTALVFGLSVVTVVIAGISRVWGGRDRAGDDDAGAGAGESGVNSASATPLRCQGVAVWPYRPLDLIGAAWVAGIYMWLALAQVAALATMDADPQRGIRLADLWVSIFFQGFMACTVMIVMWPRIAPGAWLGLRPGSWPRVILLAPLSVGLMWMFFALLQLAGYVEWVESLGAETVQESVQVLRSGDNLPLIGLMAFAAVVVAPVCEEIVFRGYLYGVAKRYCGAFAGALATSLAFAAAHASLVALLPLAMFGLLLTWLYERTGTIWAPIAAHACFNAATVAIQLAIR